MVHYAIPAEIADAIESMSAGSDAIPSDSDAAVGDTSGQLKSCRSRRRRHRSQSRLLRILCSRFY
jgi:hypothetical protein